MCVRVCVLSILAVLVAQKYPEIPTFVLHVINDLVTPCDCKPHLPLMFFRENGEQKGPFDLGCSCWQEKARVN